VINEAVFAESEILKAPPLFENARNPEAVAAVQSGKLTVANAAWWGFDEEDATEALQAAVNSGARKVIVPNLGQD